VTAHFSRREFIRIGGLAGLGALAVACSKKSPLAQPSASASPGSLDAIIAGRAQNLDMFNAATEILPNTPEIVAFAVARTDDKAKALVPNMTGRCWVASSRAERALGPFDVVYHGDGLGSKGVYEATITFPKAGSWLLITELRAPGAATPLLGGTGLQVGKQTTMPGVGDKAISVATPTVANHRGVSPICTRHPACSMHALSLDDALRNGKPTVLIIATPAFCQSQLCGPEVDIVQDVAPSFAGKANFIHVEVYRDDKAETIRQQILSPAAQTWRLDQEPAIYYIAPSGTIVRRSLGPVDRANVRDAVTALVRG
jgi:hypothetical protein